MIRLRPSLAAINPHVGVIAGRARRKPAPRLDAYAHLRSRPRAQTADAIVPIALSSIANARGHWSRLARVKATQRAAVAATLRALTPVALPCTVTVTRIAPRALDNDNATAAAKAVRDEVADWLGVDDRDPRVTWVVRQQQPAQPRVTAVRIAVESSPSAAEQNAVAPDGTCHTVSSTDTEIVVSRDRVSMKGPR